MIETISIAGATLLLILLKLFHVITWNWFWVVSPLWLPLVMLLVFVFISNTMFELLDRLGEKELKNEGK